MLIDWAATKAEFDKKYSQAKVAKGIGVDKVVFCRILNGNYPHMDSTTAKKVLAELKGLGVLVPLNEAA